MYGEEELHLSSGFLILPLVSAFFRNDSSGLFQFVVCSKCLSSVEFHVWFLSFGDLSVLCSLILDSSR